MGPIELWGYTLIAVAAGVAGGYGLDFLRRSFFQN